MLRACTQTQTHASLLRWSFAAAAEGWRRLATEAPGVGRLNHVAVAVPDLAAAAATYRSVLGASVSEPHALPEHGVTVVFVQLPNAKLELLEPLGEASPIAGFLKKNPGGGIHHVCLEVADIHGSVAHAAAAGVRMVGNVKTGAHGLPVAFLHPKDMNGVLTELEEVRPQDG